MRINSWPLALLLSVVAFQVQALSTSKPGDLIEVSLDQLHPTQGVIGFDQIYYKLGRFAGHPAEVFDQYCESNGQGKTSRLPVDADLLRSDSFDCENPVGTDPKELKTVVMGPKGVLYLTDGHHTFSTLWDQPGAGPELKMWVKVTDDFSDSADSTAFWARMQAAKKTWLKDGNGQIINPSQLPEHLGTKNMQNDPYRSLVYFTRSAAFGKPELVGVAPEFLEFYWGDWLRKHLDIKNFDLNGPSGYQKALNAASELMVQLPGTALVGDSGFNARQLGGFSTVNDKELLKTVSDKLPYVLDYKAASLNPPSVQRATSQGQ